MTSAKVRFASLPCAAFLLVSPIALSGAASRALAADTPAAATPPAPDYSKAPSWAALPDKSDGADAVPPGAVGKDGQKNAPVDVFFIHPTTTFGANPGNMAFDEPKAAGFLESAVLRTQASAFNSTARVFAPRYRQSTGYAFFVPGEVGAKTLELAYGDVEKAFDNYIATRNGGRPFMLAAHSQGALHLQRLLQSKVTGTPLVSRLVAVYAIGYPFPKENVPADIPVATHDSQVGGLVSWNTFIPGANTDAFMKTFPVWVGGKYQPNGDRETVQVNPLNWSVAPIYADRAGNLGALPSTNPFGPLEKLVPGFTGAQIHGVLYVDKPRAKGFDGFLMGDRKDNFHSYDYALFYGNIRANAKARVDAFLAARAAKGKAPAR